ncbi:MAG: histidinol-phosphate transaminase, partial [Burkholderiales bacterium]
MIDLCDLTPSHIRNIAPYQPGKPIGELQRELGLSHIIKLASNENPLGPSPKALAAIKSALPEVALYPDGNGFGLKSALATQFSVAREAIVLGNGSNDILELVARAFLGRGTSAVYSQHAFAVYPLVTQAVGAERIEVAARDFAHDLEAMIAAIRSDTRVLFVANP